MATNNTQNIQQAYVVQGTGVRPTQTPVQLELFDAEGNPWSGGTDISGLATQADLDAAVARIEALENPAP